MSFPYLVRLTVLCCAAFSASLFARDDAADVADVIAAEKERGKALVAADLKALAAIFADDLRYTHSNGALESKDIFIAAFGRGLGYEKFETFDLHGQVVAPDVVVLTGRIDQRKGMNGTYKGNDPKLMFQAVWHREAGRWRLRSMQTATLPATAAAQKK